MDFTSTDNGSRARLRDWINERASIGEMPRHGVALAVATAIELGNALRSAGRLNDAADEYAFAATMCRTLKRIDDATRCTFCTASSVAIGSVRIGSDDVPICPACYDVGRHKGGTHVG